MCTVSSFSASIIAPPPAIVKSSSSHPPQRNAERLYDLETRFNKRLIGQEQVVHEVCSLLKCIVTGFYDENVPYGVLLFAGPTGVGKTELSKMIADELAVPFLRYDMSEFGERHTVSSLLGAPPGYLGSDDEGRLVNDLKRNPVAVILLDEIEKAHPDIYPALLQLLDEGRLTDRTGNHITAKSNIFIMTTNLGSSLIQQHIASSSKVPLIEILKPLFIKRFTAEFYNRIHKALVFKPLSSKTICKIARLYMKSLAMDVFQKKQIVMKWTSGAIQYFVVSENNLDMGARGIHRRIRRAVLPLLADYYIAKMIAEGDTIRLKTCEKGTVLKVGVVSRKRQSSRDSGTRVIRVCTTKQPLKNLIGKYALRAVPFEGDSSFMGYPTKIVSVNEEGILVKTKSAPHRLEQAWNDNQWLLPTPFTSARHFLLNLSLEISDKEKRKITRLLIKKLYSPIDGILKPRLESATPWTELIQLAAEKSNAQNLFEIIEQLKKNLGPLNIEWPQTSASSSTLYSSSHYDFHLFSGSNKRKEPPQ